MRRHPRKFAFQYRLIWKYKGELRARKYVSDSPGAVLRMLRRVGTDSPHLGVTPTQFKRAWAWLARRVGVGFQAVAHIPPNDILIRLRDSFPRLEWIRVEQRQVAMWSEVLDPLESLRSKTTAAAEMKREMLLANIQGMTPEQLDAWRWVPDETAQAVRTRGAK